MSKKGKGKRNIKKIIIRSLIAFFAVILSLILVIALIYFVELRQNKETNKKVVPLLNAYIIVSPSMKPTINVQDAVIVRKINPRNVKKKDIITFVSNNSKYQGLTITHRVIAIKKMNNKTYLFKTKGDYNNAADTGYINGNDIYGKVLFRIPKLGYVQDFLSNAYGWILLVLMFCLLIMVFDSMKLYGLFKKHFHKTKKKSKKEEAKTISYDALVTKVDPVCSISKNKNKIYYYDLVSAMEFANKEETDTTIKLLTKEYVLPEKIEIDNKFNKRITLSTADNIFNCCIYKSGEKNIVVKKGDLVLNRVIILNKVK